MIENYIIMPWKTFKVMNKYFVILIMPFFAVIFIPLEVDAQKPNERPKLVVGIVIDQMRNDYIHRYYDDFGEDGFKRLIEKGFYYSNAHYNYFPTYTAPGHASVYTGATPAVHGIVGNYWYHKGLGEEVYCTTDNQCQVVGGEGRGMSSQRLVTTTVSDELKLTTNHRAKVIGISIKDRGAILPAGHMADAAYWFNDDGHFISSTYYMEQLPTWVTVFNERKLPVEYIKKGWDKSPDVSYDESTVDDTPYESRMGGKDTPTFPYDLSSLIKQGGVGSMKVTPYGNDIIIDMAEATLENEDMGVDEITDLLALSFSATDYVGHAMGVRSMETQDTYIRLDRSIARLLSLLDEKVGKDNYLIFMTADHGANDVPQYLKDNKVDAEALVSSDEKDAIKEFSIEKYGENVIKNFSNHNLYYNSDVIKSKKLEIDELNQTFRKYLLEKRYIKRVYTAEEVLRGNPADKYLSMIFSGFDPKQNGDLVILLNPGYMFYKNVGTTHGSPYIYDTHVPVVWYGWNIKPGRSHSYQVITDIAPTLSQKINISMPSGSRTQIMEEIFR